MGLRVTEQGNTELPQNLNIDVDIPIDQKMKQRLSRRNLQLTKKVSATDDDLKIGVSPDKLK